MNLVLQVIGKMAGEPGLQSKKSWSEEGGSIGRASNNDWTLPDPDRYVSGKHGLISYQVGTFCITDVSVNGIYINGAVEALGTGNTVALKTGDTLAVGDYLIEVAVSGADDMPGLGFNDELGFEGFPASPQVAKVQVVNELNGGGEDPLDLLMGSKSDDKDMLSSDTDAFILTQPTQPGSASALNQAPMDAFLEIPEAKAAPSLSKDLPKPSSLSGFGIPEDWDADEVSSPALDIEDPFADLLPFAPQPDDELPIDDN
ncbi:MAG: FHA domain-containing protein, partial [Pseudomonadales bacterium]|nr:FHA domain-containing protein [Pseudomonadales bacterium]